MPIVLKQLDVIKKPTFRSLEDVEVDHNQWVEIFDAAKNALKNQSQRGGAYSDYEVALKNHLVDNLNMNYVLDVKYGDGLAGAKREALYEMAHSNNIKGVYSYLESEAAVVPEVKAAYETLQAQLKLAKAADLTFAEQTAMNSVEAVENKVASRVLGLLRGGGPFVAGITAADLVVVAKTWVDQLPDTASVSSEMAELRKYVNENGVNNANDHILNQYMQSAAPER